MILPLLLVTLAPTDHPVPEDPRWLTFAGGEGPGAGKHVVLIAADQEYRSEQSMPMVAHLLAEQHGFHTTVLFGLNEEGLVDPTQKIAWEQKGIVHDIPGLEHLESADAMILFTRLLTLPAEQRAHLHAYLDSGKPILALRTANHGFLEFDYQVNGKRVRFGDDVLGGAFRGHHGRWHQDSTRATAVPENGSALGVEAVGLLPGDRVLEIDGNEITTFGDLQIETAMGRPDVDLRLVVERAGVATPLQFTMRPRTEPSSGLMGIGIMPASSTRLLSTDEFPLLPSFLERAGLTSEGIEPGMSLSVVDGESIWNYEAYRQLSESSEGKRLSTTWVIASPEGGSGTSRTLSVDLEPVPQWQTLQYPGATPSTVVGFEDGLLGLVPLVQLTSLSADSPNTGVLEPGDIVLRFGNHQAPRMQTFRQAIIDQGSGPISMTVLRDGNRPEVTGRIAETGIFNPRPMMGVTPSYAWSRPLLAQPMRSVESPGVDGEGPKTVATPVASAGLLGGTEIVSIDGKDVSSWRDIWQAVHAAAARSAPSVTMVVRQPTPGQSLRTVDIPLDASWTSDLVSLGWSPSLPYFLFEPLYVLKHADGNPFKAMVMGVQESASFAVLTYLTIDRLFRGTVNVEHLQGPVGIVHIGSKVADRGFSYLLFFLGLISVNLAVINFLPLPIVDGGLFLYLIYESIKGRPPSIGFQNGAAIVGLLLIATAFGVTFYNDIARIVG